MGCDDKNPEFAYHYALRVDKCAMDDTRSAVLSNPEFAYEYAGTVDKCSRDDTRNACIGHPGYVLDYAQYIDNCFREDTYDAIKFTKYEERYIELFGDGKNVNNEE